MMLEKKTFPGLDLLKFICSILIIFLHINPFPQPVYFITKAIGNLGVPCFFIISGFLFFRKLLVASPKEQMGFFCRQIKRLAILLGFWLVVYFVVIDLWWILDGNIALNLLEYCKHILFGGSDFFLWFVVSSIVGMAIAFLLWRLIGKWMLIPACLAFLIGAIPSAYNQLISGSFYDTAYQWYCTYFYTVRNGLFFAFPCISLGMLLAQREDTVLCLGKKVCWFLIPSVALFIGDCILAHFVFQKLLGVMALSATALSFVLVLIFLQLKKEFKNAVWMRKMSFLIYVIHPLWLSVLPKFLSLLSSWDIDYYWYRYWGVQIPTLIIVSITTTWLLILLSKKISFLKKIM